MKPVKKKYKPGSIKKRALRAVKKQVDRLFAMDHNIIEDAEDVLIHDSDDAGLSVNQIDDFDINDSINHDIDDNDNDGFHSSSKDSENENEGDGGHCSNTSNNEFSNDDSQENLPLGMLLAQWSVKHQITLKATSDLLSILRQYHLELPKTAETLRMTSKRKVHVKELTNGQYVHLGFLKEMRKLKKDRVVNSTKLLFDFNFDGISIYKSARSECWPITARCVQFNTKPFPVGIFYGTSKPNLSRLQTIPSLDIELAKLMFDR
ncbi:uncharacterized protein [Temnothorax nylanderi]|uniref:uncharacterized protein n=1 Tax=Temnothorax nylanderi TaxID=102681 RepID=UPI003A857390